MMDKAALFGTAGSPENFYADGFSASADIPAWLKDRGLDAYEYSAGRGVRIKNETAAILGEAARQAGVVLSLHAPYFINLNTADTSQQEKNLMYITSSIKAAMAMGAGRVIFHAAGQGKLERAEAFETTRKNLVGVLDELARQGLDKIPLLPETMGKKGQIGTLEEVVELCRLQPGFLLPAVDFGHLYAVGGGAYITKQEYLRAFGYIGEKLGESFLRDLHIHFSRIEFTKAGERRHLNFSDGGGPPFEPLLDAVRDLRMSPHIICESAGQQDTDALAMKNYYTRAVGVGQ